MKKLYTFVLGSAFTANAFAQGQIMGFTVDPASPTTADNVYIYVDVQFTSGGCDIDSQGSSTSGSSSSGYGHHCIGALTVICNTVDTFNLGMLPAGPHVFDMTLTSGSGGAGCTPGFAPDDNDVVNFIVSPATGISSFQNSADLISIYPHPVSTTATIKINDKVKLKNAELKIIDIMGRTVKTLLAVQNNENLINAEELTSGVYFYQLTENGESAVGKFVVE